MLPLILTILAILIPSYGDYQIGIGRSDCTGPAAEIVFMGYAKLTQVGCGLHLRQFSRAFIIDDGDTRVVYVSVDSLTIAYGVKRQILKNLAQLYGDLYRDENVLISGTHTHSTPGGWLQELMLDIPCLGFVKESFDVLVEGITQSIINAHENMVQGKIFLNNGTLLDANINRSPASYLYNPEEERARYEYNVDKEMVQLKFVRSSDGKPIGVINWFAVHPTSMNNTNCLISSDNVGLASITFENYINPDNLPGTGDFVGAFASTNLGDVSPNTKGPICIDTGEECDFVTSTCNGNAKTCIAFGPGDNMVESTKIIASKLYEKALELFEDENSYEINGPVKFIHQFVDMPNEKAVIELANGTEVEIRGCPPAMGYSFAGGTTDGPGEFDFAQGTVTDNPFWDAVRDFVFPPTEEEIECHAPKPILINTGGVDFPYSWQPKIVTTQILQIGEVVLLAVPGEFTTMSGRRLREAVTATIIENGGSENTKAILTGHSNIYTNYIATYEEYQLQRYEGGSTIYGPHTLNLYINKFKELAAALVQNSTVASGPTPPDFSSQLITLVGPASSDGAPSFKNFGDCTQQPPDSVSIGETVSVQFVGGNPRHNVKHGGTFLAVEKSVGADWLVVASDANWETRYLWKKVDYNTGESTVTIEWDVNDQVESGSYRIRHFGNYKDESGDVFPYEGITNVFEVV